MSGNYTLNRMANSKNEFQGPAKRVLCVCSAGLLRSPTTAALLQHDYGYNTRAAGVVKEFALIFADQALVYWADEIVFMDSGNKDLLLAHLENVGAKLELPPYQILNIEDSFARGDMELEKLIRKAYKTDDKRIRWVNKDWGA